MAVSAYRLRAATPRTARARALATIDPRPRVGFVSTFPPTRCGLATFTASLGRALARTSRIGVVTCVDEPGETAGVPEVVAEWVRGSRALARRGGATCSTASTRSIVQHEFGLFGGPDGADIVELVDADRARR